jgi:hypothetical protein
MRKANLILQWRVDHANIGDCACCVIRWVIDSESKSRKGNITVPVALWRSCYKKSRVCSLSTSNAVPQSGSRVHSIHEGNAGCPRKGRRQWVPRSGHTVKYLVKYLRMLRFLLQKIYVFFFKKKKKKKSKLSTFFFFEKTTFLHEYSRVQLTRRRKGRSHR